MGLVPEWFAERELNLEIEVRHPKVQLTVGYFCEDSNDRILGFLEDKNSSIISDRLLKIKEIGFLIGFKFGKVPVKTIEYLVLGRSSFANWTPLS